MNALFHMRMVWSVLNQSSTFDLLAFVSCCFWCLLISILSCLFWICIWNIQWRWSLYIPVCILCGLLSCDSSPICKKCWSCLCIPLHSWWQFGTPNGLWDIFTPKCFSCIGWWQSSWWWWGWRYKSSLHTWW